MPNLNLPTYDTEFRAWLTNFAATADAHQTELALTSDQVADLMAAAEDYSEKWTECVAAKALAKGRVASKNQSRASAEELVRTIGGFVLKNPDVSITLKIQMGMSMAEAQISPLNPVADLACTPQGNGVNQLRWDRNGNSERTVFIIQMRKPGESEWDFVATTSRVRYSHTGQIPGKQITYRVISQRGEKLSGPSGQAVAYSADSQGTEIMAKAA